MEGTRAGGPRRFGQLPDLVVPDNFDAPLPNVELDCDELPSRGTIADLDRAGAAAMDLDDPQVMRRAWE